MIGKEPGKRHLAPDGALRIAEEEAFRGIGWKSEVGMEEGLRSLIAWRENNEGKTP